MSLDININFDEKENMWVFGPEGELDIFSSPNFKEKVVNAFESRNSDIKIDFEKLEYVDSTGLGALISILRKVKEKDNNVYIHNIKPNIKKLFLITELDKLFIIRSEIDE
ncbi:MAG: STAS domain-containing protein [Tissierellia bacterium]|jgi:anti-sigma B factor antagonist|nr:STAS domain-containing protein [Tissierellia bacterium]